MLWLLSISVILFSCTNEQYITDEEIFGLASPINLSVDTTIVILNDYFMDVSVIRKLTLDSAIGFFWSADKKELKLWAKTDRVPALSMLDIQTGKGFYQILVKRNESRMVKFIYHDKKYSLAHQQRRKIFVRGDFNGWSNIHDSLTLFGLGFYTLNLRLEPGVYQYLFNVDDKDELDADSIRDSTSNGNGGYNSVIKVGMDNTHSAYLSTYATRKNEIEIHSINVEKVFVLWQNQFMPVDKDKNGVLIINLPVAAKRMKRSYIRVYGYERPHTADDLLINTQSLSNDLLIPLENGKVITDAKQLTREDKEGNIYYFMMVDRFLDGNKNNTQKVKDDSLADRANYYGGDLAGITQKIKEGYFSSLGINTLWVSPLNQNPEGAYHEYIPPQRKYSGYHGYWVVSISNVDHRFGTEAELIEMVAEAHKRNINVILDFVSNHVHMENPIYQQHKDEWFNSIFLTDGTKNLRRWNQYDLTTWFDEFLADIDYTKDAPLQLFTDSAVGWIKRFDLDGFRHDAVKHVPQIFWRTLTYKLKKEIEIPQHKHLIQIGETFGSRALMKSYIGSGQLDAQFDFNVYFDSRIAFIDDKVNFTKAKDAVNASLEYFGHHHLMGNITGNHDITRFMAYAGKGMSFSDNDRETGWNREVKVEDTLGYNRLQMMTAFITTIPGTPVIYYGDEIGMTGANDPDNRRPMIFDSLNKFQLQTRAIASKLCALRRSQMSLMYGTYEDLECNEKTYSYLRRYFNEATLVIFNKSNVPLTVSYQLNAGNANTSFGSTLILNSGKLTATIVPYGFEIITIKE